MEILKQQYGLIKSSRGAMLGFIGGEVAAQLKTPLKEFNGNTLNYLLVHTANTYKHWLGNFAMKKDLPFADENNVNDIDSIQKLFDEVDELMAEFLDNYNSPDVKVTNTLRSGKTTDLTMLELFTHVVTHEFHHKGQIMTMCRLLGYTPIDTDVIRF